MGNPRPTLVETKNHVQQTEELRYMKQNTGKQAKQKKVSVKLKKKKKNMQANQTLTGQNKQTQTFNIKHKAILNCYKIVGFKRNKHNKKNKM